MTLDFTQVADTLALVGCAGLLIVWVLYSRRLLGFLYVVIGWALLIAARQSGGDLTALERSFFAIGVGSVLLLILYGVMWARRRRVPVYVPIEKRKR